MPEADATRPADAPEQAPASNAAGGMDDPRVASKLEEYCEALEQDKHPKRDELLRQFPALSDELEDCLNALEFVHGTARQVHGHVEHTSDRSGAKPGDLGPAGTEREGIGGHRPHRCEGDDKLCDQLWGLRL